MSVPTIEQGGSDVGSGESLATTSTTSAPTRALEPTGPAITFSFSDGQTVRLSSEALQTYLAAIQVLLLLYVTVKEVSR